MATSAQAIPLYNQPQVDTGGGSGLIRVMNNTQLDAQRQSEIDAASGEVEKEVYEDKLSSYIRNSLSEMRNFRNGTGISERLLHALRTYKGEYSAQMQQDIKQFGGSNVYARVTATKCRAATALLRDVYLGAERPFDVDPTPHPSTPADVDNEIQQLVNTEVATMFANGVKVDPQMIADRVSGLRKAAERAAKKVAVEEADKATDRLNDILTEGGFYQALAEFLIDLPIFPYAIIKGPTIRRKEQTKWVDGQPIRESTPKMYWDRVSPFDLYWSQGASHVKQADFIEKIQLSRAELSACKGIPGYNEDAINAVLEQSYMDGLHEWWDTVDTEREQMEDRRRWAGMSNLIDTAEFTGYISGRLLLDWGMDEIKVPDPHTEYFVTAWLIDQWVIKVQINKTTNNRPPYYISSFEKVPGAIIGLALPDLLEDVQTICNAAARSLVNNASIASGPQVVINDEVIDPADDDELYPWKRWHVNYDPSLVTSGQQPVTFFQPNMNVQELMGIYSSWFSMADEISAIPRYMTGSEKVGGAGRTASGLAMLMGNASKTLQNVAASVDRDVVEPLLMELFDMVMLTQPGVFKGDELIVVKGVNHAVKREQDRMRQLEFLQLTANPVDMSIVGPEGRANVLRSVAQNLGLDHERVLPDDDEIRANMAAAQQQASGVPPEQGGDPSQTPGPQDQRAGPEAAREEVEGDFTGPTGRPGMRAGG